MPSLSDIPEHLLPASQKAAFIRWIRGYPLPVSTARTIAHRWSANAKLPLTAQDWQQILENTVKG